MFVTYDPEIPPNRDHPWTVSELKPGARYYDFGTNPELIPVVLEDFVPWAQYPAIQRFYELLNWVRSDDSVFESNDCGLLPPRRDPETPELVRHVFDSDPIGVHGRLTIIFRDLKWNTAQPTVDGLKKSLHDGLASILPNPPAVVGIGEWKHLFKAIDREGSAVVIKFWAWGDDEAAAMNQLGHAFNAIHSSLKWISDSVKRQSGKSGGGAA